MSDIKIDQLGTYINTPKTTQAATQQQNEQAKSMDVTVTNHLSKLVNLLGREEAMPEETARVLATKRLVDSGHYQVDVNSLSEKLLNSGLLNSGN